METSTLQAEEPPADAEEAVDHDNVAHDEDHEEEHDYVLVDGSGEPIPAGAEGSVLMALQLQEMMANGTLQLLETTMSTEPPVATARTPTSSQPIEQSNSGFAADAGESAATGSEAREEEAEGSHDDEEVHDGDECYAQYDDEDQDEEGMAGQEFSREYSDQPEGEEEWILEEILRRRDRKLTKRELGEEVEPKESQAVAAPAAKKASLWETTKMPHKNPKSAAVPRVTEYLCKWKWYREPTWETKELLGSEGYYADVMEFEREQRAQKVMRLAATKKAAASTTSAGTSGKQNSAAPTKPVNPPKVSIPKVRGAALASITTIDELLDLGAPSFLDDTQQILRRDGRVLTELISIASPQCVRRHIEYFSNGNHADLIYDPKPVFHGTRAENFASISRLGLVVPGKHGVTIANGNVLGDGIYAAVTPRIPFGFAHNEDYVIVCLAVEERCTINYDVRVFKEEACILPIWIVRAPFVVASPSAIPKERTLAELLKHLLGPRVAATHIAQLRKDAAKEAYGNPGSNMHAPDEQAEEEDDRESTPRFNPSPVSGQTAHADVGLPMPFPNSTDPQSRPSALYVAPPKAVVVNKAAGAKVGRLKTSGGSQRKMKRQQTKPASDLANKATQSRPGGE